MHTGWAAKIFPLFRCELKIGLTNSFSEFSRTEAEHVQSEKTCDLKVDSDWLLR
jgi:hypothetical protein